MYAHTNHDHVMAEHDRRMTLRFGAGKRLHHRSGPVERDGRRS